MNEDVAKKAVRDVVFTGGQFTVKKLAPRGVLFLGKSAKYLTAKTLQKIIPGVFLVVKAVETVRYVQNNKERIEENGGGIKGLAEVVK